MTQCYRDIFIRRTKLILLKYPITESSQKHGKERQSRQFSVLEGGTGRRFENCLEKTKYEHYLFCTYSLAVNNFFLYFYSNIVSYCNAQMYQNRENVGVTLFLDKDAILRLAKIRTLGNFPRNPCIKFVSLNCFLKEFLVYAVEHKRRVIQAFLMFDSNFPFLSFLMDPCFCSSRFLVPFFFFSFFI